MTVVVLGSSHLSASLLTMLVPIATISAIVAWGLVVLRRHERDRERIETGDRSAAGIDAAEGPRAVRGE
jgi:hypothetical protein